MNCSCSNKKSFKGFTLVLAAAAIIIAMIVLSGCAEPSASHMAMSASTADSPTVNSVCPMKGRKFDPTKVPAAKIRHFNGHKVGFCCSGCPANWDKLTDAQKSEKLKASM